MQLQAKLTQAHALQPTVDNLQGCHLLRHEEHGLSRGQALGDEVGDRLGLSRARRALQDEGQRLLGGEDGRKLGGVRVQGTKGVPWMALLVQLVRLRERPLVGVRLLRVADQVLDHGAVHQLVRAGLQVPPHEELGEREVAKPDHLLHVPALDVEHRLAKETQHQGHVHTRLILGHLVGQLRDLHAPVLAQLLHQSDVDLRLFVDARQLEGIAGRAASELHRQQKERGQPLLLRLGPLVPGEEPHGQVEGGDAALLKADPRGARDLLLSPLEFLGRQRREEHVSPHLLRQVGLQGITPGLYVQRGLVPRICRAQHLWPGVDQKGAPKGQGILHPRRVWTEQLDGLLGLPEVQQPVAQ